MVNPQAFTIELYRGLRDELRALFALADDSASEIDNYIEQGEVFVARYSGRIVGHVQLTSKDDIWEIKSIAVEESQQGQGAGSALVRRALERAFSCRARRINVATASAGTANLRFYQRLGFRMDRIERDAFTETRGYSNIVIDGIPLRDRVWLSIDPSDFTPAPPVPGEHG